MWAFATRSRVGNCQRFINTWIKTKASSPVYLRLDKDDPDLEQLLALPWPSEFLITVGPRARISKCMQEMFEKFPTEPWYGVLADDLIPRTDYWDQKLISAAGTNDISYADDIHEKAIRICHPCVGGDLVRAVGFFGLPVVQHFGTDTVWENIHHHFNRNNKQHDVIVEHAHFNFGQAQLDQTYQESQAIRYSDKQAYKQWMEEHYSSVLTKIEQTFGWTK